MEDDAVPLYAVSRIDWADNDLVTEFHSAETWKDALRLHSHFAGEYAADNQAWIDAMPDNLEEAKNYAFDADSMIEVVEVP